jgi:hypothetical protein
MPVANTRVPTFRERMAFASPPVAALLEISRDLDGNIPGTLITAAYRASKFQPVVLVLDQVTPREVDAVLDPAVSGTYREHRGGVLYASASDDQAVMAVAAAATRVFAATPNFRAKLASRGIPFEDLSSAEPALVADLA